MRGDRRRFRRDSFFFFIYKNLKIKLFFYGRTETKRNESVFDNFFFVVVVYYDEKLSRG